MEHRSWPHSRSSQVEPIGRARNLQPNIPPFILPEFQLKIWALEGLRDGLLWDLGACSGHLAPCDLFFSGFQPQAGKEDLGHIKRSVNIAVQGCGADHELYFARLLATLKAQKLWQGMKSHYGNLWNMISLWFRHSTKTIAKTCDTSNPAMTWNVSVFARLQTGSKHLPKVSRGFRISKPFSS